MGTGTIYMYTAPNGKRYVGQTWDEQKRRWDHRSVSGKKSVLHAAITKYGKDVFVYEILHSNIDTQDELNRLESEAIKSFNTIAPNGYNLTTGGEGGKHHETTKQKLRDCWIGKKEERIAAFKKAAQRPEVRQRLKHNAINNAANKDLMKQRSEKLRIAFSKDDVRKKRSEQRKSEWANPEIRQKRLQSCANARLSEEYKNRQVEIMKIRWESEEYRKIMSEKLKGKKRPQAAIDSTRLKRIIKVECIETGCVFESIKSAADFYGIRHSNISSAISGRQKTAAGKTWRKVPNATP